MDKTLFHFWAEGNDVLVPKSRIVKNSDDLKRALECLTYPVVLKPLVRTEKWDSRFSNDKLIYITDETHINVIPADIFSLSESYILQEWIPGGDENVYFVLVHINEKKECVSMTGRKLLQWPVLSGSTALCVSVGDQDLTDLGVDILIRSGLKGLGSIEFKRHDENDRYYVIEPTVGRNDYQSYIATASNINLSLFYALNCLEYSYMVNLKHSNAMWIDEINSLRSLLASYSRKKLLTNYSPLNYKVSFANLTFIDLPTFIRLIFGHVINKIKRYLKKW
jgi:predicted ATP-grasp superfamily ATP-dependent carboligase